MSRVKDIDLSRGRWIEGYRKGQNKIKRQIRNTAATGIFISRVRGTTNPLFCFILAPERVFPLPPCARARAGDPRGSGKWLVRSPGGLSGDRSLSFVISWARAGPPLPRRVFCIFGELKPGCTFMGAFFGFCFKQNSLLSALWAPFGLVSDCLLPGLMRTDSMRDTPWRHG